MKNTFNILVILVSAFTFSGLKAQKKITEGTIQYDIVVNTGNTNPSIADMFNGATSIVYLKGFFSRFEMVSSLGVQSTIIDGKNDKITVLKEYGEQKYKIGRAS